ncbi:MAG: Asp-tRNA(Asn)/Glu-tRNA(Gln) amidotransferase subunit GatC [Candidatus Parvarchaeota archaeon]|nr:Asp-tRNA(Asn)/Glu-tRNA(Gln) amidotransferase subunit GatC [Candidatus Parvarchaeota archaeon]
MEDEEFDRLLRVCRLKVSSGQRKKLKSDADDILHYFDRISEVQCDDIPPAFHSVDIDGRYRKDMPLKFDDVEGILKNTKTHRFFVVGPKI